MEALGAAIGATLIEPCGFVFGYVRASTKNFFKRKSNFNALKNDIMSSLTVLKKEVKKKLDLKDEQSAVVITKQVRDWVRKADELKTKMDEFLSTISTSDGNNLQDSCCPFPLQCNLSNKLAKKIKEANLLMDDGKDMLEKMGDVRDKTKPVEHIPGPSIIGQNTASENLARVLDLLSTDGVTRIGVWGMGGVGKTTLVRNLNNKLGKTPSAQAFSVIVWVTVSKETNLKRIQTQIIERLNLAINMEQNEERMAIRLHDRLLKEIRFLLILDDVWEVIDLDHVGIPRPEECPMSKIIITSRKLYVCRGMMTQVNLEVKVLIDEEAWKLFREHAGEVVMEEHIRPLAETVARECDGLPLAIIVVGASMREKSLAALWKDALKALQMSEPLIEGIEDKVFKTLKWSYDSLKSKSTKYCFLYCCLYPEDFDIEVNELVRYWYCEGLLDERLNYEEVENRGIAIIQSLKDCCLLEDSMAKNSVKMHDVVRDVGIWIADSVEDECRSLVRSGIGLTCLSENDLLDSYKRLSFMCNKIVKLPECIVQCQAASTLLLQENWNLATIPASFLEGFHALKILDLSQSRITHLPPLFKLQKLQALILHGCNFLRVLPSLDGLRRLLVLDCSRSGIRKLPESLEKLSNLRQLDISDADNLETVPYAAISKLSNLEVLKLSAVDSERPLEGQIFFEVLTLLKKLMVLYADMLSIPDPTINNVYLFERIKEFKLTIGDNVPANTKLPVAEKSIIFYDLRLPQESIGWLLCNAKFLTFDHCKGLTNMFNKLVTDSVSFASLKVLVISDCDITFGAVASFDLLPNLEKLELNRLDALKSISDLSKLIGLEFSRLKRIVINECWQLKSVISLENNQTLERLEEIQVADCKMLKSLFNHPNPRAPSMNQNPTAPNLREVLLDTLPNLESLWRNDQSWKNLQRLKLLSCPKVRKLPFTAQNAEIRIKEIRGAQEWWNQLEWDSEDTKMLLQEHFIPTYPTGRGIDVAERTLHSHLSYRQGKGSGPFYPGR